MRPGESIEQRTARLRATCGHAEIPTVLVAFRHEELLGSAMLVAQDMDSRPKLSPWLAGVYVRRDCRHQGIGAALVHTVEILAAKLGHPRLYLYTPGQEEFYRRLDWTVLERATYRGAAVAVMMKECPNRPA